jgi:hypothetical protein
MRRFQHRLDGAGMVAIADIHLGDALAVETGEARHEGLPASVFRCAAICQYSSDLKRSISPSRSQTSRSATDCTRPAERAPGSLRHRTGDRVKPTR